VLICTELETNVGFPVIFAKLFGGAFRANDAVNALLAESAYDADVAELIDPNTDCATDA
jgi:hypothetical protein